MCEYDLLRAIKKTIIYQSHNREESFFFMAFLVDNNCEDRQNLNAISIER